MTLLSPGVEISVIDDSFYNSASPGSIPLIIVATASNKIAPSATTIAPRTIPSNAGKLYLTTSQRDLVQQYGNPVFYSSGGTPLHGNELNEYGIHAAYQFLGISDQAYILRADIDTASLIPNSTPPVGVPVDGTYWFDVEASKFGLFLSNGNAVPGLAWVSQAVLIATNDDTTAAVVDNVSIKLPKPAFGVNGNFAISVGDTNNFMFEKIAGAWYRIGSTTWKAHHSTVITGNVSPSSVTANDTFTITQGSRTATVILTGGSGLGAVTDINNAIATAGISGVTATAQNSAVVITDATGSTLVVTAGTGTPLTALGIAAKTYKGVSLVFTNDASYPTGSVVGDMWIKGTTTNNGANLSLKVYNAASAAFTNVPVAFYPFTSTVDDGTSGKDAAALAIGLTSTGSVYVGYDAVTGVVQFRRYNGTAFEALSYEASETVPSSEPAAGTLWYSADFSADIMVSNGINYLGYRNFYPQTDPKGVFVQGSKPLIQTDGTALVDNDVWLDTTDLENYPKLRRYTAATNRWVLIDNTDQTSPFGIKFADARQDSGTTYAGISNSSSYAFNSTLTDDLVQSNFLDPDAPDPRTVPSGMLLFNTRFSNYNVKQWTPDYFGYDGWDADTDYSLNVYNVGSHTYTFPPLADNGRWVTVSGNREDGSPLMGRRAQRAMITKAMATAVINSDEARSEIARFNLIAAPGYPELLDEMVSLNTDQKNTAFIIGDVPIRLAPNANDLTNWESNAYGAASNGEDGLTTSSDYVGIYYPWGLGTNVDGTSVMIPPSTMLMRVMAYNDQVAYPWFAPAGLQRGIIDSATSVGYLTSEGEYQSTLLNQGLRDALYSIAINPIAFVQGTGLVVLGQKTRNPLSTALDRVNVARLVNYMSSSLDLLAKPFLFQQNDQQTRDSFAAALNRFLSGLVGLRAIEDYAVQCDTDNNTRERINRSELWADIAILPVKSVEYIYIPIRLTNDTISS